MEVSKEEIEFDDALAAAFVSVKHAEKDAVNPHFGNHYPTLTSVINAINDALTAGGFSYPQLVTTSKEGGLHLVHVTTQLRRKGIKIESTLAMPVGGKGSAQDIGSAITYARRYSLAAMMGVCPDEDDDGEKASQPRPQSQPRPPAREPERPPIREPENLPNDPVAKFKSAYKASGHTWLAVCEEAELTIRGRPSDHELKKLWKALGRLNSEPTS